jgi:VIT1/CCC1 family predicted Fe2+/Mn2+ transporter
MKKTELIQILNQRIKECESHRKKFEKQLDDIRNESELGFDREILGGIQHPIGYLTGVIEEIKNTKRLLKMSLDEYEKEKKENKRLNKKHKKYLKSLIEERKDNK